MTNHFNERPPLVAFLLLRFSTPLELREAFLGDLHEQFQTLVRQRGIIHARRWYWKQLFVSVWPLSRVNTGQTPLQNCLKLAVLFVLVAVVPPVKNANVAGYLAELFGLMAAAFLFGWLGCRLFFRFPLAICFTFSSLLYLIAIVFRGEFNEIPWLMVFASLIILVSCFTDRFINGRSQKNQLAT